MTQFVNFACSITFYSCAECGHNIFPTDEYFRLCFLNSPGKCPRCLCEIDVWKQALDSLTAHAALHRSSAVALIGGREVSHWLTISPGEIVDVDLTVLGVPAGSRILYVIVTPDAGGVIPVELTSNELRRPRTGTALTLYGRAMKMPGREPGATRVSLLITFVTHGDDEHEIASLADAFEAFQWDDFAGMVVPAAVAVEDSLERLFTKFTSYRRLTRSNVGRDGLLLSILPLISDDILLPRLTPEIAIRVKRLWGLRDMIAHNGRFSEDVSLEQAAEKLCAAIFACRYVRIAAKGLDDKYTASGK